MHSKYNTNHSIYIHFSKKKAYYSQKVRAHYYRLFLLFNGNSIETKDKMHELVLSTFVSAVYARVYKSIKALQISLHIDRIYRYINVQTGIYKSSRDFHTRYIKQSMDIFHPILFFPFFCTFGKPVFHVLYLYVYIYMYVYFFFGEEECTCTCPLQYTNAFQQQKSPMLANVYRTEWGKKELDFCIRNIYTICRNV